MLTLNKTILKNSLSFISIQIILSFYFICTLYEQDSSKYNSYFKHIQQVAKEYKVYILTLNFQSYRIRLHWLVSLDSTCVIPSISNLSLELCVGDWLSIFEPDHTVLTGCLTVKPHTPPCPHCGGGVHTGSYLYTERKLKKCNSYSNRRRHWICGNFTCNGKIDGRFTSPSICIRVKMEVVMSGVVLL